MSFTLHGGNLSSKKSKLIESAQKNLLKGLYDRAVSEYRQIIHLDPADIRHRQKLAEILTKAEKKDEAINEYTSLAKHYIDSVHYLKAIAVYKQIQKLDPSNPDIALTLASLNEKQGLIGNATAEYASAVHIYESKGENLKALKALEAMSAIDPRNCAVRLRIAEKYFSNGREDQSADEFVAIARELHERSDENGFLHIAEKIKLLFQERAAELFVRIEENNESAGQPVELLPTPVPADDRQQQAETVSPPEVQSAVETDLAETAAAETAAVESPATAAADDGDIELIEDIEPFEEIEELEELEVLPFAPADADWEEEINFEEFTPETAVTHEPLRESDADAALELCSELEDIELELEIDEDEQPDTAPAAAAGQYQSQLHTGSDDSFDLGKELSVFADEIDFDFVQTDNGDAAFALDSSSGLKKSDLDNEDTESHYSLGLAYREMGLFDEAISEFIVASHSAGRRIDCLILQGICFRELGEINKAAEFLTDILSQPELTEDEMLGIKYELAVCHEALGETMPAKQLYSEIMTVRADFSDTAARISQL